jgi:hypothetical protein
MSLFDTLKSPANTLRPELAGRQVVTLHNQRGMLRLNQFELLLRKLTCIEKISSSSAVIDTHSVRREPARRRSWILTASH